MAVHIFDVAFFNQPILVVRWHFPFRSILEVPKGFHHGCRDVFKRSDHPWNMRPAPLFFQPVRAPLALFFRHRIAVRLLARRNVDNRLGQLVWIARAFGRVICHGPRPLPVRPKDLRSWPHHIVPTIVLSRSPSSRLSLRRACVSRQVSRLRRWRGSGFGSCPSPEYEPGTI